MVRLAAFAVLLAGRVCASEHAFDEHGSTMVDGRRLASTAVEGPEGRALAQLLNTFVANDGATDDSFGCSVAVSPNGSRVVVGAWKDDGQGQDSGSAYLFDGVTGEQLFKLVPENVTAFDMVGWSVDMSADGESVVVGSWCHYYYYYYYNDGSGTAHMFNGTTGAQLHEFVAEDKNKKDMFGGSVAVSSNGTQVAVGSPRNSGRGYVYVFDGTTSAQLLKLWAEDAVSSDWLGYSVAMSSDGAQVVVGAFADDDRGTNAGSAYAFDGFTGAQLLKFTAEDAAESDWFGVSVAVSADGACVVVGAYYDDSQSGSAYVFDGATGQQLHKLVAEDRVAGALFGISVAVSSDGALVAVGAAAGSAYVFDGASGAQVYAWAQGDEFGTSVAMSSDGARLMVGAPGDLGSAFMFDVPPYTTTASSTALTSLTTASTAPTTNSETATNTYSTAYSTSITSTTNVEDTEDTASKTTTCRVASIVILSVIGCLI